MLESRRHGGPRTHGHQCRQYQTPMFKCGDRDDMEPGVSRSDTSSVATSDDEEEGKAPTDGDLGPVELLGAF